MHEKKREEISLALCSLQSGFNTKGTGFLGRETMSNVDCLKCFVWLKGHNGMFFCLGRICISTFCSRVLRVEWPENFVLVLGHRGLKGGLFCPLHDRSEHSSMIPRGDREKKSPLHMTIIPIFLSAKNRS